MSLLLDVLSFLVSSLNYILGESILSSFFLSSLFVSVRPRFTIVPSDQTVVEKDQVTFTCSATGNPVPNITWIRDGKTVQEGDVLSFEATRNHSGIYQCLADNGIEKSIQTNFSFNVQCKYRMRESLASSLI